MSIAEQITQLKTDFDEVYEAGYTKGKAEGGDNPLYYAVLLNNVWGGVVFPENYDFVLRVKKFPYTASNYNMGWMLNNAGNVKTVKLICDNIPTEAIYAQAAFAISADDSASPKVLELIDLREFNRKFRDGFNNFCDYQRELKSILGALDLSAVTSAGSAFRGCSALTDIEFVPNTIPVSIWFEKSTLLSDNSIQSIIDGLITITDGVARTITFHADVKAKLTDEQKATITTTKGWTLA